MESGIPLWNPESWYSSTIRNPSNDWNPEYKIPLTKKIPESSTRNLETTAWNPESKTVSYSVEKSLRHVAMDAKFLDLNKPWSCKYGKKKKKENEKIDMYDFPVHDGTREQKVVLFFYRSTMQMAVLQLVSVKK